ncbi:hypothetical protein J6590_095177 [Homalodisca vitripennis]|nr:hypothetical protein J6590_095177 [Homalodisca vitripennis]
MAYGASTVPERWKEITQQRCGVVPRTVRGISDWYFPDQTVQLFRRSNRVGRTGT